MGNFFVQATGNSTWVNALTGNDATGVRSSLTAPFQTISAALLVSQPGDTVFVYPGTYSETLTMVSGVSVQGLDRDICILSRSVSSTETTVTMAADSSWNDFTYSGTNSSGAGTLTAISFPAGATGASLLDINVVMTGTTGNLIAVQDFVQTGGTPSTPTAFNCNFTVNVAPVSGTNYAYQTPSSGTSDTTSSCFNQCSFVSASTSTSIAFNPQLSGVHPLATIYLLHCSVLGGLKLRGISTTIYYNSTTTISPLQDVNGDVLNAIVAAVTPYNPGQPITSIANINILGDDLSSPPVTGVLGITTVSVTNGSGAVTGTSTSFTVRCDIGSIVQFGNQTNTYYTVVSITSNTALVISPVFSGTTNASTTMIIPREGDSYIVGSSPTGPWSAFSQGDVVTFLGGNANAYFPQQGGFNGLITLTNGSPTVTCTNGALTNLSPGITIYFSLQPTVPYIVQSIASETSLTLTTNYSGPSTGAPDNDGGATAKISAGWVRTVRGTGSTPQTGLTIVVGGISNYTLNNSNIISGSFVQHQASFGYYDGTKWSFMVPNVGQACTITGLSDSLQGCQAVYYGSQIYNNGGAANYQASITGWGVASLFSRIVSTTTTTTTTSTSFGVLGTNSSAGMYLVPACGTYEVVYEGVGGSDTAGDGVSLAIYMNNVSGLTFGGVGQVASTVRTLISAAANSTSGCSSTCIVTVSGVQNIEIRSAAVTGGTASVTACTLKIKRLF